MIHIQAIVLLLVVGPLLLASLFARSRGFDFRQQLGTVTLAYTYPQAVVPTQATMLNYNMVLGTLISGSAADTQQIVTHDLNLPAADISNGFPEVVLTPLTDPFGTSAGWFVASQSPNFTVFQKGTLGTGPTTKFQIARPHSIVR